MSSAAESSSGTGSGQVGPGGGQGGDTARDGAASSAVSAWLNDPQHLILGFQGLFTARVCKEPFASPEGVRELCHSSHLSAPPLPRTRETPPLAAVTPEPPICP